MSVWLTPGSLHDKEMGGGSASTALGNPGSGHVHTP